MWVWEPPFKWEYPLLFDYLHVFSVVLTALMFPYGGSALVAFLSPGSITTPLITVTAALCFVTVIALETWSRCVRRKHGGIQAILEGSIQNAYFIPVFAGVNAFIEEAEYRGVILCALLSPDVAPNNPISISTKGIAACLFQAILFGLDHYHGGFPSGVSGFILVTGWGFVLGLLRCLSGGILLSYAIHIVADATIGFLVLRHRSKISDK